MQTSRSKRCPDCYGRARLWGDGRCSSCAGSGNSLSLSHPEWECRECHGTGVCSRCNGDGRLKGPSFAFLQFRSTPGTLLALPLLFVICVAGFRYHQSRYLSKATASADAFHRALSEDHIAQIYADADESFRRSLGSDAAVEQINDLRQRLVDCQYPRLSTWNVSGTSDGLFVVTRYRRRCADGEFIEALRWHIVDGSAKLASLCVTTGRPTINGRR